MRVATTPPRLQNELGGNFNKVCKKNNTYMSAVAHTYNLLKKDTEFE
jgi:hypothetical protein